MVVRVGVIALAVALALVSWLATRDDDGSAAGAEVTERVVSTGELREVAASLAQEVYWAGEMAGARLQLVEFESGVQVRYLREGVGAGESLTVGTYSLPDAAGELRQFAAQPGSVSRRGEGGRVVVRNAEQPTSAYFTSAGGGAQVEVYDPSPPRAMRLALSTRVRPVGGRQPGSP